MADKLAKLALINKPIIECSDGYTFIKNIEIGELIRTQSDTQAVILNHTKVSTSVLVTKVNQVNKEDRPFYLGKHRWGCTTEVKVI